METRSRTFDCVEMKRRGAERVRAELDGLSQEEELEYWQRAHEEFRRYINQLREARQRDAELVDTTSR